MRRVHAGTVEFARRGVVERRDRAGEARHELVEVEADGDVDE